MVKNTIGDALKQGIALLNENLIESSVIDANVLMCSVLNCDRLYLIVHREDVMKNEDFEKFFSFIKRRASSEPVGYILNHKEFMSLDFYVDKNVLIPRPDTEILVEEVISRFDGKKPKIIDACTGSGAIAVSLAKYIPGALVTGLDISEKALEIAKFNAEKNQVKDQCEFILHDVLTPFNSFADALVSNPPYIPKADVLELEKTVKDFEPKIALDGGDDGLDFYKAITKNSSFVLKKGGLLAFEVGCGLAKDVFDIMSDEFEDIKIIKDLSGIERVVIGIKK